MENGQITKSLPDLRLNESLLLMLNNIEASHRPKRLAKTEEGGDVAMPSTTARDSYCTSLFAAF